MSQSPPPVNESPSGSAPGAPLSSPSPRRRSKFRPIIFCVALLGLAGALAYGKWKGNHDEEMAKSIKSDLEDAGVDLIFSTGVPRENASGFQPFASDTVVRVQSGATKINDETLNKVRDLNLELNLVLNECAITDAGLAKLQGMPNVRWLQLRSTKITNDGVKYLKGMDLETVDLSVTKVDDAGLATMVASDFPNLKDMAIEGTGITDAGLAHLGDFKSLEFLSIAGTNVSKDGLSKLRAKLPNLMILGGDDTLAMRAAEEKSVKSQKQPSAKTRTKSPGKSRKKSK